MKLLLHILITTSVFFAISCGKDKPKSTPTAHSTSNLEDQDPTTLKKDSTPTKILSTPDTDHPKAKNDVNLIFEAEKIPSEDELSLIENALLKFLEQNQENPIVVALKKDKSYTQTIKDINSSKKINLSNANIIDISLLEHEIFQEFEIQTLDLSNNNITTGSLTKIINNFSLLEELDLSNAYESKTMAHEEILASDFSTIKTLKIVNTLNDDDIENDLEDLLREKTPLEEIHIQKGTDIEVLAMINCSDFQENKITIYDENNEILWEKPRAET